MTFRSPNRVIELEGINYIRDIVQGDNSIFQEIDRENDQGNDAYIEFVDNNEATNCCVFIQIKSGTSYKDLSGHKIPTDKKHLNYWSRGLYLMVGIVYDPDLKRAFWIDLSNYASKHLSRLDNDHHTIRVSSANEFSKSTFNDFMQYCMRLIAQFKTAENYLRSLESFSSVNDPNLCYEGLKSLYSNFRNNPATWFTIISNFGTISEGGIHRNILGLISNYTENPHIFWHKGNMAHYPSEEIKAHIKNLLSGYFDKREFKIAFPYLRDGINKGSFSFQVFLVLDMVKRAHEIFRQIAFEDDLDSDDRNHWFWLYLHSAQHNVGNDVLDTISKYYERFPECKHDEIIEGMVEYIRTGQLISVG